MSGFFLGYAPVAPGTFGTFAALPFYFCFIFLPWWGYAAATLAFTAVAVYLADRAEGIFGGKDDRRIVADEMAGFLITMTAVRPDWKWLILGFLLFRVFDILKPWPAGMIDKRLKGGLGVVLDDVAAGVYAALVLQISIYFFNRV